MFHLLEGGILLKLFGIFLCEIFVCHLPFMFLFNNLCLYEIIIQEYFILLLKLFHLWPLGALTFGSYILLTFHHHYVSECVCVCVIFLNVWHCKMPQVHLIYFLPEFQNQLFLQDLSSFYWKMLLVTKFWVLGMLAPTEMCLIQGPLSGKNKEIYVCVILCICQFSQFSRSVVSDSLQPHESQHTRPPCPSPTLGVHQNPCPLSR